MLIAGHGARQATGPLHALAERLNAPVLTTFKAKGPIPNSHPLGAGVLGRSGTPVASWLMNEAEGRRRHPRPWQPALRVGRWLPV